MTYEEIEDVLGDMELIPYNNLFDCDIQELLEELLELEDFINILNDMDEDDTRAEELISWIDELKVIISQELNQE